jgi:hypothetical protein
MAEVGIGLTGKYPNPGPTKSCGPATSSSPWAAATPSHFPGKRDENWELSYPAGQGLDAVRPIRDDVEERV